MPTVLFFGGGLYPAETCEASLRNPASKSNRHERRRESQSVPVRGEEEALRTLQGEVIIASPGVGFQSATPSDFHMYSNKCECQIVSAVKHGSSV